MKLRHPHQTRPDSQGFTLIELLIATLCFAIIVAALNSAFYAGLHLRAKTTRLVEDNIPLSQAAGIIKRDLLGILPTNLIAGPLVGGTQGNGRNGPNSLEFYTTSGVINDDRYNHDQYWGEVQRVDYYLQKSTDRAPTGGRDLMRSVTRNMLPSLTEDFTDKPLLSGVDSLEFLFYDGTQWQPTWDMTMAQTNLPLAIKMSVRFALPLDDGPALYPMEFVAPLVMDVRTNQLTTASSSSSTSGTTGGGGPSTPNTPNSPSKPGGGTPR